MTKKTKKSAIDFKDFAMKKDLEKLVTKQDLNEVKQDLNEVKQELNGVKQDLSSFKNETLVRLDKIIATQGKHEQERIFAFEQSRRHDEQIEKNTKDIKHIKEVTHIS